VRWPKFGTFPFDTKIRFCANADLSVPMLAEYPREIALAIVVIGITFASIVLGELVPCRIAMQYP
jgi:CBS domain containing-hemolysin-like protein